MTVETDVVEDCLRTAWPHVVVDAVAPLTGGFWATMVRVEVSGQPAEVAGELVVRFAPDRAMGAKEAEVQRVLATLGFPTPAVHASGPDEASGGWWSVSDFVPGSPLLAGLDGPAALRRAPSLARTLPAQLAGAMAALHRLDPEPVTVAVYAVAPEVSWEVSDVVGYLEAGAVDAGRSDVAAAIARLAATTPPSGRRAVLCHGDVHPFNLLDRDGELVLLDWTGAVWADPCFDVAYTELLLANPPLGLPGPLKPVGWAAGRVLARRFIGAYERANPGALPGPLSWFRALHSARILVEIERRLAVHGPGAGGHPFATMTPAAARNLSAVTGTEVQP